MKDGQYGSPPRRRDRCIGEVVHPKTGQVREFHRFGTYAFPLCEVAATFVAVGTSAS